MLAYIRKIVFYSFKLHGKIGQETYPEHFFKFKA
jgi:hypothetical protein